MEMKPAGCGTMFVVALLAIAAACLLMGAIS